MKKLLHVVEADTKVRLADYDADDTGNYKSKAQAETKLDAHRKRLFELQELLYAEDKRALLVVLQGMDGAGKDGTIRHIFTGVNPQGCQVTSFKVPSEEELQHDFLWRVHKAAPRRGMIGIFNRSHYEDVLVVRVHQKLSKNEVQRRFEEINNFERELADHRTHILKFFLHISKDEQKKRLQARLDHPQKYWKVSPSDLTERQYWDEYVEAYEDALSHCSTKYAPWYIVPANHKWYRNVAISEILLDTLDGFKMKYPKPKLDIKKLRVE
jgi:PPK2 family polyphosphate:nucleotide phosphotransferase